MRLNPAAIVVLLAALLCSCGTSRTVLAAANLQAQFAAGGNISLPEGTIEIGCGAQLTINKTTKVVGAGRNETILKDTCPTGDTLTVDMSNPITVTMEDLQISHVTPSGTALRAKGGIAPPTNIDDYMPMSSRMLKLTSVELNSAQNCLVTEGFWLLFMYQSRIANCGNDGAQIASFGVTLHDNWIQQNGRNGVTFLGTGFCASCIGNEYIRNGQHGLEYNVSGNADAWHNNEYIDTNRAVGLVVSGVRQFTYNNGWIGSNEGGGAVINDGATLGVMIVGTKFCNNSGPGLTLNETAGPLRLTGNLSSLSHATCDANVNGKCVDLNAQ